MRVGIMGDGPAGCLAAWLFKTSGHPVLQIGKAQTASQSAHIHIYDPRLSEALEALGLSSTVLDVNACDSWRFTTISKTGDAVRQWNGPRCGRDDALKVFPTSSAIEEESDFFGSDFDLLIDASGGARALIQQSETEQFEALVFDTGQEELYRSWAGPEATSEPSLIRLNHDYTAYLEQSFKGWRLTLIEDSTSVRLSDEDVLALLNRWAELNITILPRVRQMRGPIARRVLAEVCLDAPIPIIPFGDALVQTSPSLGFGILSVANQGLILKGWLDQPSTLSRLAADLDHYAETLWHESALRAF